MDKLTKAEREVVIRWDLEEKIAYIDAAIPKVIHKLDKLCRMYPDVYKFISSDSTYGAKRYTVDSKFISFKRPISEHKHAAVTANLFKSISR